jgi:hypothetical protein
LIAWRPMPLNHAHRPPAVRLSVIPLFWRLSLVPLRSVIFPWNSISRVVLVRRRTQTIGSFTTGAGTIFSVTGQMLPYQPPRTAFISSLRFFCVWCFRDVHSVWLGSWNKLPAGSVLAE